MRGGLYPVALAAPFSRFGVVFVCMVCIAASFFFVLFFLLWHVRLYSVDFKSSRTAVPPGGQVTVESLPGFAPRLDFVSKRVKGIKGAYVGVSDVGGVLLFLLLCLSLLLVVVAVVVFLMLPNQLFFFFSG